MKTQISTLALIAALAAAGAAFAQAAPSGGPDAKGNAPLKAPHTVNDGSARGGANSFTENQAREHIERAGFSGVSGLSKGDDGVWRGTAMRGGSKMNVAMDFKGNVTTAAAAGGGRHMRSATTTTRTAKPAAAMAEPAPAANDAPAADATTATTTTTAETGMRHHRRHHRHMRRHHMRHHYRHMHHHHHHHHMGATQGGVPGERVDGPGAAISGVDSNHSGISDPEKRAIGR